MMDAYCQRCHEDTYNDWFHSAHHFSSFNNEPYLFSVKEYKRPSDGARWRRQGFPLVCGCHDVVPFLSGAFDDPEFDIRKPRLLILELPVLCHAITHVNSTKGNAAYTLEEPIHYPFAKVKTLAAVCE